LTVQTRASILQAMQQLDLFQQSAAPWTVSDLTAYLRVLLESQPALQGMWVQGEVSNFSRPKSGHWYFTLKDDGAALPCVMWRSLAEQQFQIPKDGDHLEIRGGLSIYEAGGRYQFYVDELRPAGEGALYQEFLRLKAKLEVEGLFAVERKRAIPVWPRRIGIVTSPTGAALRDVLNTLTRRYPLVEVTLAAAAVQGPTAANEVAFAIRRLNRHAGLDLILLARGGGSLEDLSAFNAEIVARAIVASKAPIICGVGHETDFTIADFAADLRAPTPTAAAELATPDRLELSAALEELQIALARNMRGKLREHSWELEAVEQRLQRHSPLTKIASDRQRIDDLGLRSERALRHSTVLARSGLNGLQAKLLALNPTDVLKRGYSVVSKKDGRVIRSHSDIAAGEELAVQVSDGKFAVRVSNDSEEQ
jgi:exodeoxyribonuclease VII large subunit